MPSAQTVFHCLAQGTEPSEADIKKLIRKGTIGGSFVPVLCGSAFKNKGVQVGKLLFDIDSILLNALLNLTNLTSS